MIKPESIDISRYDYLLDSDRIAKYPLADRDDSLLLNYHSGTINHHRFRQLPELLDPDDMLVFNNTRVIQARLEFIKSTGARIEIFCLEPSNPADYEQAFQCRKHCEWHCMVGNAKKWKNEQISMVIDTGRNQTEFRAELLNREDESFTIRFSWEDENLTFGQIIEIAGATPIPPYLNRSSEPIDKKRYQTIYSRLDGSVAAPTAGLHFTGNLMDKLTEKGIILPELTLHVGAGTFRPVQHANAASHTMHFESVLVNMDFLETCLNHTGRIIPVGTTSTRSIESLYWLGIMSIKKELDPVLIRLEQWKAYSLPDKFSWKESFAALKEFMETHHINALSFHTQLMIVPGYKFRVIDGLITNYHMPRSTLLLLVAALIGDDWKRVYDYARENNFRFLSYGDSSLLIP